MNFPKFFTTLISFVFITILNAQVTLVSGVVYDITGHHPLEAVTVKSSSSISMTDSLGRYIIVLKA